MMKQGLNISFFASSLLSAYWNGAATYYRGIIKSLHRLGHRVVFYEPDAFDRQQHRDISKPDYADVFVYPARDESTVRQLLEKASDSDIIVKASGVGVFDELLEREVLNCKSADNMVVFWDVDASVTLERVKNNPDDPFRKLIPLYDLILTYGGGDPVINAYTELGAKQCVPVYNALDPETHFPAEAEERFRASLGFLGNRMPDREARVWEFFFKPAGLLPEETFLIGGNGWTENVPQHKNLRSVGHVFTAEHNAFNSSVKAALNISRQSMASYGFSPSTRIFEAAGAAACIITDLWEGIELFLTPGTECLRASSGEEVAEILKGLTQSEAERIGQAARKRILKEHTYDHRAAQLERLLMGNSTGKGKV